MTDHDAVREHALVRAGWELVDLLGQLPTDQARKLLKPRWEAERARAAATLTPLATGDMVGERVLRVNEGPSAQTRFRRTLDFVRPGDRVFEIGPGRGYLAGLLLRDGQVAAYRGVDITDRNLVATRQLLELNGVAERAELGIQDLYELTRAEVEGCRADLLVCCEVIEHVPDPERALKTLAAALPPGTDLLISVPLHGRLEQVWGHVSIFNAARIRDMVESSGLVVHSVEAVENIWVFLLASHDSGASARVAHATAPVSSELSHAHTPRAVREIRFDQVEIGSATRNQALTTHHIEQAGKDVVCRMTSPRRGRWRRNRRPIGGVRFPVTDSPRGFRVELAIDALDDVTSCYLDAYAGGERVSRWKWDPATNQPTSSPATFVIRPGRRGHFRRVESGPLESADAFELSAAIRPGSSVTMRITRAAVVV